MEITAGVDNKGYQGQPSSSKNDEKMRKTYRQKGWMTRYSGGLRSLIPVRKRTKRYIDGPSYILCRTDIKQNIAVTNYH